jgi:hypothetical protein
VFSLHVSVPHRPGYPDDRNWFHSWGQVNTAKPLAEFCAERILLQGRVKKLFPEPLTSENPLTQQTALTFKTHAFA